MKTFCQVQIRDIPQATHPEFISGGLWNWFKAMGGDFQAIHNIHTPLTNYDIVLMGLSQFEVEHRCASRIAKNVKGKLVLTVDQSPYLWPEVFSMHALREELKNADVILAADEYQARYLARLMSSQDRIHIVPPPTNLPLFIGCRIGYPARDKTVGMLIHRYDNRFLEPWLATNELVESGTADRMAFVGSDHQAVSCAQYFESWRVNLNPATYVQTIADYAVILASYHFIYTYGRSAIECAALAVPCVGTSCQAAQCELWPELTTAPGDVFSQADILKRLFSDNDFYRKVIDYAIDRVDKFGYPQRKQALLDVVCELDY